MFIILKKFFIIYENFYFLQEERLKIFFIFIKVQLLLNKLSYLKLTSSSKKAT